MSSESLVLIVYGATGFTGQLVATYLDGHPDLRGKPWGIAGRTQSKVAQLSAKLGDTPEALCVDLDDTDAVTACGISGSSTASSAVLSLTVWRALDTS